MAWIDDRLWCHPKFTDVSDRSAWTWVKSVTYSTGFQTHGHLTAGQQKAIGSDAKTRRELVAAGLWDETAEGAIQIHDWDEHNSKRDARRAADRDRKRRARTADVEGNRLRESDWNRARARVYQRDGGICVDCGCQDARWHADHVPDRETLRASGLDLCDIDYIQTRCTSCHSKRTNPPDVMRTKRGQSSGRARVEGSEGSEGSDLVLDQKGKVSPPEQAVDVARRVKDSLSTVAPLQPVAATGEPSRLDSLMALLPPHEIEANTRAVLERKFSQLPSHFIGLAREELLAADGVHSPVRYLNGIANRMLDQQQGHRHELSRQHTA